MESQTACETSRYQHEIYNIHTLDDIIALSDECVARAEDRMIMNIHCTVPVKLMMTYGIFPLREFNAIDVAMIEMDKESYAFWFPEWYNIDYQKESRWYYSTLETHKRNGIQEAVSLPLMYIAPHLVYKGSKRPVTEMNLFRSPISARMDVDSIVTDSDGNSTVVVDGNTWNCIRVTRYGSGMNRGMYYKSDESLYGAPNSVDVTIGGCKKYCGTFYYHEPESTTFLAYKTSRTYFNKTDAILSLGVEFGEAYAAVPVPDKNVVKHLTGQLPANLMMTAVMYSKLIGQREEQALLIPDTPQYIGLLPDIAIYAKEDGLDQILCSIGKKHGIDVFIFDRMVGAFAVVREVLDNRDRAESFKNLIYTNVV